MKFNLVAKAVREAPRLFRAAKLAAISQLKAPAAECPICEFQGKFLSFRGSRSYSRAMPAVLVSRAA